MERIPIAQLTPQLRDAQSKEFRGVVTLVWPYSSSARQFALLLAEPDLRLRRRKGQVRIRFSGSSAKALAATCVGIGDEVVLGLRGAQFVQHGTVSTPGKSIDWELSYEQTIVAQGSEPTNLDLIDAAPTPTRRSPVRQQPHTTLDGAPQWSSPAFLKRARLSNDPFFEAGYDPLLDEPRDEHDTKRRRKSYRDWKVWSYSARTPSPEKEEAGTEDAYDGVEASPSRPTQLPETPVSPIKPVIFSVAGLPLPDTEEDATEEDQPEQLVHVVESSIDDDDHVPEADPPPKTAPDDFVRDADYYDLYAGPDELPPSSPQQVAYWGDTEPNTEEEEDDEEEDDEEEEESEAEQDTALADHDMGDLSATEADTDVPEYQGLQQQSPDDVQSISGGDTSEEAEQQALSSTEENTSIEIMVQEEGEDELERRNRERSGTYEDPILLDNAPQIIMPPPNLPALQTDFRSAPVSGTCTPIGEEPQSPTLKPLDSSTLPLPSPFPGEKGTNATSYLDPSLDQDLAQSEIDATQASEPQSEGSYIEESSFYSSVGPSNPLTFHPTHESAFTDVRFPFGLDGTAFSRPRTMSPSPRPQDDAFASAYPIELDDVGAVEVPQFSQEEDESTVAYEDDITPPQGLSVSIQQEVVLQHSISDEHIPNVFDEFTSQDLDVAFHESNVSPTFVEYPDGLHNHQAETTEHSLAGPEVIVLSSGSESDSDGEPDLDDDVEEGPGAIDEDEHDYHVDELSTEDEDDGGDNVGNPFIEEEEPNSGDLEQYALKAQTLDTETEHNIQSSHRSTATTDVIDLGSPSEDDSENESLAEKSLNDARDIPRSQEIEQEPQDDISFTGNDLDDAHATQKRAAATKLSESMAVNEGHDQAPKLTMPHGTSTYTAFNQESETRDTTDQEGHHMINDENGVPVETEDEMSYALSTHPNTQGAQVPLFDTTVHHLDSDIKMESIEEDMLDQFTQAEHDVHMQEDDNDSVAGPSAELLIAVPEEGHKVGELLLKSVPATGPARNTRSKTKPSMSPVKAETPAPQRQTSSRMTNLSLTPTTRTTLSQINARSSLSVSTTKESMSYSPYSLRSPTKRTISPAASPRRRSPRNRSAKVEIDVLSSPSVDALDLPDMSFGPSQELGTSQGKFSNVLFVRDSEEDSLHSEHSISTNQFSDDRDGVQPAVVGRLSETAFLKPPYLKYRPLPKDTANSGKTQWRAKSQMGIPAYDRTPPQPNFSFITQPPSSSPSRRQQSTADVKTAPSIPRHDVYELSSDQDAETSEDDLAEDVTLKAVDGLDQVEYPQLPSTGEGAQVPSSPPTSLEERPFSPLPVAPQVRASITQQSAANSNMPITPEATQHSFLGSQPTLPAGHQEQSLPMTPKLSQTTSAGTRSFPAMPGMDQVTEELPAATVNAASPERSPSIYSEDLSDSDDSATLVAKNTSPSIGLSTNVAYYTPLTDMIYFLNRSSQFHSSANPDVLGVVTASTTPAKQADKGAKHWSTTLHVTDLSLYPAATTVQCFRAYREALPVADMGDVVLLRAFQVKSLNRQPVLLSGEQSAWCVWRYGKPVWGAKRGAFGEVRAREEVKGPAVEKGEGEWKEVEILRRWWLNTVKRGLEEKDASEVNTRAKGKAKANGVNGFEGIIGDAEV
ncbi:hypothetical protein BDV95DRAFT_599461 [Massariosphaeria phaeospora]|uniref:Telomeric single stranded DNA binding POT1/Cdc13 domain-containing protein n=1 Tax=Massariosphaeria phaeospora TaxID=100035 RepID=A0A7C8MC93_9PLEO|nr:hypothetical protein BDV95DRAFT_599461 [Massariosphaeria phaeospora]